MSKCRKCGKTLPSDNSSFCPYCGEIFNYKEKKRENKSEESEFSKEDIEANRIYAAFSYVGILVIVPYVFAGQSDYAMFHAKQGFTLFVIKLVLSVLSVMTDLIFIPWAPTTFSQICKILQLILSVVCLVLAITAFMGKTLKLPFKS